MSKMEFLYLIGVIVAFLAFGVTLAWGERRTHNFVRPNETEHAPSGADQFKKAA